VRKELIKEIITRLAGPGIVGFVDRSSRQDENNDPNESDDAFIKEPGELEVDRLNT